MPETVLFDRYRLLEPAGRGGSAEVWRALDTRTGEEVAVKRLHPVVLADAAGRRRLEREFDALRSLDEPHIVRVRDLHFGDREAALVLDFIAGESLARRLARNAADGTRMEPAEAARVVDGVAAALAAAHAAGIVHRDVTPGNILLTPDGETRLTDFGIAHADGDAVAVTATGTMMGTMRYLAPEQLRGGTTSPASDLHSLAAVAYEMLAGQPAYEATSPVALADAQETGPAPIAGVLPAIDAAVRRGLAVDPAQRPADVQAFAAGLRDAIGTGDVEDAVIGPDDRTAVIPVPVSVAAAAALTPEMTPRRSGFRGIPAPAAVALGVLTAAVLLSAAIGLEGAAPARGGGPPRASIGAGASRAVPTATAKPAVTPNPKPDTGNGHGGHGKGHGD